MNLVARIQKETEYRPNRLEKQVINTIEKGDPDYRMIWHNYLNPKLAYALEPRDIQGGVRERLYLKHNRHEVICSKVNRLVNIVIACGLMGGLIYYYKNPKLKNIVIPTIGALFAMVREIIRSTPTSDWYSMVDKDLLEAIERIKKEAGTALFKELEKSR